jgi:dTDP-4-dehydrorhamnose reductase
MKILITGGNGFLGQYLNIELSKEHEILTLYHSNTGNCRKFYSEEADINDYQKIERIIKIFSPEVIIHTAAVSTPLLADSMHSKVVYQTNVVSTKNIAELSEKYKAKLIFTSTDLVYAGYRGSMLTEDAKIIPVSLYAETKIMGEEKIKETSSDFLILRMALMYGFGLNQSRSHFDFMFDNLNNNKPFKLFFDQYRTPLSVLEAARIINKLCKLSVKNIVINVGGKERLSRLNLGEKLCSIAGLNEKLIIKTSMKEMNNLPQVEDVSMNTDKLQSLGIVLTNTDDNIREILNRKIF